MSPPSSEIILDAIPVAEPVPSAAEQAAALLEQAVQAGRDEPHVLRLLALAYQRQGKPADARSALRRIARPDAGVHLQLGMLAWQDGQPAQAEGEFARARQADPSSYAACRHLLLARLALGRFDDSLALLPDALALAPDAGERDLLGVLQALLRCSRRNNGDDALDPVLLNLPGPVEERLLETLRGLGQPDVAFALLKTLLAVRPDSPAVQEAYAEAGLVHARQLLDRARWADAEPLLARLSQRKGLSRETQAAVLNLLGVAACLNQGFDAGARHFKAALKQAGIDARLHQNLALAHEWLDQLPQADPHWNRYLELLDRRLPVPPGRPDYLDALAFEALSRLAQLYADRERWSSASVYLERAHELRPRDADVLERLYHVYSHARCPDDARRVLDRLRALRPADPQLDLFELELVELQGLEDVERLVARVEELRRDHPDDARVDDRSALLLANVVPFLDRQRDQLSSQVGRIVNQVRNLANYQVNWPAVREAMRDLHRELGRLRKSAERCQKLVRNESLRRTLRDLLDHVERRMDTCRSMMR